MGGVDEWSGDGKGGEFIGYVQPCRRWWRGANSILLLLLLPILLQQYDSLLELTKIPSPCTT